MSRSPRSGPPRRRGFASLREVEAEGLRVEAPPRAGAAVARTLRLLGRDAPGLPPHLLPLGGLAALALGWFDGAADAMERACSGLRSNPEAGLPVVFLAACYGLVTGDVRTLSRLSDPLVGALEAGPTGEGPRRGSDLARARAAVHEALVRAVEPGGGSPPLAVLRRAAGRASPAADGRPGADGLSWGQLAALLPLAPSLAPGLLRDADEAARLLDEAEGSEAMGGLPPTREAEELLPPIVLSLGILGLDADACYGRMGLAPSVPARWERLDVSGVRMGDCAVQLSYRRTGGRHTFVLRQTRGRVPVNVVFEPRLPGTPERVLVDGAEAEVDRESESARGRAALRLQLPLDRVREISVEARNP